jgi:hypothetical protein
MYPRLSGLSASHARSAWGEIRPGLLDDERGDVPGWVLITLMTAALVVLIWALAGPALEGLFRDAMERIEVI